MNTAKVNAYAKLNLTLDITGEENGYHTLDSLVVTVDLSDRIVAKKRRDNLVNVFMHGMGSEAIPPERNNALRAGEAFVSRFRTQGADIKIYKNIPVGAGMGGSSADAAGVLNAMAQLYAIADTGALKELADGLGSDTGYLLSGGFARITGRGERVENLGSVPAFHFLVLVPPTGVDTKECYHVYDERGQTYAPRTERALELLSGGNEEWAGRMFGNALFEAGGQINPAVREAYLALKTFSPFGVWMTGSGSAVCALFESRELCEWAKSRYRGKCRAYVLAATEPKAKKKSRNPFVLSEGEGE